MADLPKWEPTVQKTNVKLRSVFAQLHKIWEEVGFTEDAQSMYCEQAYNHINDLLNDMLAESMQRKEALLKNAKHLMEQLGVLCKELGTQVTTTGYEHLSLREVEETLHNDLNKLQHLKEQRLTHFKELLAKERIICKNMGTQPIGIDSHLPSEEELNNFKFYLEKQEAEKNRLEIIFKDMRRSIIKMMGDLGILPSLNFEHLICNEPENFAFTTSNMTKLRELRDQYKEQLEEAEQHVKEMRAELIALWKYLNEPQHICQSFLDSYSGCSMATVNALSAELERCKEKRRGNIAKYVAHVRDQLVKLWDLCKYSEDQRRQFIHFNSITYTEDLLMLHELEVEKVQKFYDVNKPIFDLLNERENLWIKMKELVQRADNPDRFYNRGGQLLMEEKERKKIQKQLPKIEEQLKEYIREYENTHGETFTVNGMSIEDLLIESWENFNEEKEIIKKARKEAKDKSTKKTPLSTSKRTPIALNIRQHNTIVTSKRKLSFNPSPNTSMKRKHISSTQNRQIVSGSKIRRSGRVTKRIIQSGSKTPKSSQKKQNHMSHSSTTTDSTYSQFQEHLDVRTELRSSLLPEQVLKNANKTRVKTPVRTPAKPLRKHLLLTPTYKGTPKLSQSQSTNGTPRGSAGKTERTKLAAAPSVLPIIF
ncbi:hypothetical protein KM043_013577 [Ampulex compressa]|nr:hypothetical protein KM043_013577 [Ampulex compressa]